MIFVFLMMVSLTAFPPNAKADMPVVDFLNAALNELRNSLMQSQFAQDIEIAMARLQQLKATYLEITRFNSGLDDFFKVMIGDPFKQFIGQGGSKVRDAFVDFGWITPQVEILNSSTEPADIRSALEKMTGRIPDSEARPYIPFEEMQVVEAFQQAQEIRNAGTSTRDAAEELISQAKDASPKGAARLGVQAQAQMIELSQQNQEALAKLIELEATQVEQVSREEKRYEAERLKYMEQFREGVETLGRSE